MQITIFTLFPHWFAGPLGESVIGRARESGLLDLRLVNFRDFAQDRHQTVDAPPYGGGGGMVLRPDVLGRALDETVGGPGGRKRPRVLLTSPRGRPFDQGAALRLAREESLAIVCGHYEAVDERLIETRVDEEVSLGDFVLTGGEIPAMAIVDAVARLLPGVLGNENSAWRDSFIEGLLEAPHYTRPETFEGREVPEVLRSGDHGAVARWREEEALRLTRERRPDLYRRQLVHPELLRRLARRARPFAIYRVREDGGVDRLFETSAVAALPNLEERLREAKGWRRGLQPGVRVVEIREAKSGSEEEDREALWKDLERAAARIEREEDQHPRETGQFVRAMLMEMSRPEEARQP